MENKIIVDSCFDFNEKIRKLNIFETVPLKILVDDEEFVDKNLSIKKLLTKMKNSTRAIKTSCPSPNDFLQAYKKNTTSFVITLSKELSGSFNSAMTAAKLLKESYPDKFVHVFNSKSASIGETLIGLKIKQLIEQKQNISNLEIIDKTNEYISKMKTFFILESLDNLVKNGRMSKVKAHLASILHIYPIMGATDTGEIMLVEKMRGNKKAFNRLVDIIGENAIDFENRILGIAHCNALEKAEKLKRDVEAKYKFKDVIIVNTRGISTVYANDGGIVIAF